MVGLSVAKTLAGDATMTNLQHDAVVEENGRLIVRLDDSNITLVTLTSVRDTLLSCWRDRIAAQGLIVDLSQVRRIDSSGIGLLLELASSGIPLRLCCLQDSPRRLLDRTGLAGLFEVYETLAQAESAPSRAELCLAGIGSVPMPAF